jgi:hypothetical protein
VVNQATTVYPQSRKMIKSIGTAALIAVVLGAIDILMDGSSTAEVIGLIGIVVFLAAVLMLRFMRMATIVDGMGLAVRDIVRTRRVPWSRIQSINIETNPSHFTESRHPKEIAVAYLDTGRRLQLPGVDDKNLAAMNLHLPVVVESLRQRWVSGRGAGWQPIAAVQARAAEMARYKVSSAVVGLLWFMAAVLVMVLLAVVLVVLSVGLDVPVFVDGDSGLFLPVLLGLILGVPIIVGASAWIGSVVTRRRDRLAPPPLPR